MCNLTDYLKSINSKYRIECRTDIDRQLLIVKVIRGFLYKEIYISFESLADEQYIIREIRDTIELMEENYGGT